MSYERKGMGAAQLDQATIRAASKRKYASYSDAQLQAMKLRYDKYLAQWAAGPRLPIPPYPGGETQKNLDAWAGQELKFRAADVASPGQPAMPPVVLVPPPTGTSLFTGREEPVIRPCDEGAGYSRSWLWMRHAPHFGAEPGAEELARARFAADKERLEARGCVPTGNHEMEGSRMAPAYGDEYCCPPVSDVTSQPPMTTIQRRSFWDRPPWGTSWTPYIIAGSVAATLLAVRLYQRRQIMRNT
jgi:hypothetical protein